MRHWEADHRAAQVFIPHIGRILGEVFVTEAPMQMDMYENTDLLLQLAGNRIAVRVRNIREYARYNRRNEWTIRTTRPSGNPTELSKILYGWGDYYFYGWGDYQDHQIKAYTLIDLKPARPWLFEHSHALLTRHGQSQQNKDGSSGFIAVCLDDLPPPCIVARHLGTELATPRERTEPPGVTIEQQHFIDEKATLAERHAWLRQRASGEQRRFDF